VGEYEPDVTLNRVNCVQITAALVAAAFAVAGCGGSSNSANSQSSPTPTPTKEAKLAAPAACDLVTADEASTAVGGKVQSVSGGSGSQLGASLCIYAGTDSPSSVFVLDEAMADSSAAASISPDQIAASMNGAFGLSNAKTVDGIGKKASEYTYTTNTTASPTTNTTASPNNSGIAILVVQANVVFLIAMSPSTDSSKIEDLARKAVAKLH
jgi:hypothetical protein